jgi:adenine-specific DNA-methyltransferase
MANPKKPSSPPRRAESYDYPDAELLARPEIGAQAHFKKAKAPQKYRFDDSLAPELVGVCPR